MSSWANGPFKSSPALAAHAKILRGEEVMPADPRIAVLEADVARLTRENENLRAQLHEGRQRQWIAAYRENDELKAELARLREQMKDREYD